MLYKVLIQTTQNQKRSRTTIEREAPLFVVRNLTFIFSYLGKISLSWWIRDRVRGSS